jgi:CBS domain-containing protein
MRQPVHSIAPAESVARAVRAMHANNISSLIVTPRFDGDGYGIITKADVISKVVALGREPQRVRVSDVMTRPLHMVAPDCGMRQCAAMMMQHRVRRLPVCAEDGHPIGIVSDSDVFDALLNFHTDEAASFSL